MVARAVGHVAANTMEAVIGMSLAESRADQEPPVSAVWFHSHGRIWVPFPDEDNAALEETWMRVKDELKVAVKLPPPADQAQSAPRSWLSTSFWGEQAISEDAVLPPRPPRPLPSGKQCEPTYRATDPDAHVHNRRFCVPVLEDRLFDVDMERMIMYPALWGGYDQQVVRATWFYVAADGACSPIASNSRLERDIIDAYNAAEPWRLAHRLKGTLSKNRASDEQLAQYDLPNVVGGAKIQFDSAHSARVIAQNFGSKLFPFLREPLLVRGFDHAQEVSERLSSSSRFSSWQKRGESASPRPTPSASPAMPPADKDKDSDTVNMNDEDASPTGIIGERDTPDPSVSPTPWVPLSEAFFSRAMSLQSPRAKAFADEADEKARPQDPFEDDFSMPSSSTQPPHLLFCIHGIGQKLSEDYASMHFVHDLDRLRNLMRTQSQDPDLKAQLNGGRVKLIPICWRRNLEFDPQHGMYTLQDIANETSIPSVRTIINKVLLDIPFYFSQHHDTMVKSVLLELNRLYRLFVQRNPEFEKHGGRVSILAHSLGSMLAADILKDQPTSVPPLYETDKPGVHRTSQHLLFNVDHFFCVGSALPLLFYIHGAQLIARRRSDDDPEDATLPDVGKVGCLAVKSIYNVRSFD